MSVKICFSIFFPYFLAWCLPNPTAVSCGTTASLRAAGNPFVFASCLSAAAPVLSFFQTSSIFATISLTFWGIDEKFLRDLPWNTLPGKLDV